MSTDLQLGNEQLPIEAIGEIIGKSHARIVEVCLFGSQVKGNTHDASDIDVAIFIDQTERESDPIGITNIKGPIGLAIKDKLDELGLSIGKGTGQLDIEIMYDSALTIPAEDRVGLVKLVLEHSKRIYKKK